MSPSLSCSIAPPMGAGGLLAVEVAMPPVRKDPLPKDSSLAPLRSEMSVSGAPLK